MSEQATVIVGDGADDVPMEELRQTLAVRAHEEALRHYGAQPGCQYAVFDCERPGDRAELVQALADADVPDEDRVGILAEWDRAVRPVAVLHWGEALVH